MIPESCEAHRQTGRIVVASGDLPFAIARVLSFVLLERCHMHPMFVELLPVQLAHACFADWERAKHRAEFFAILSFPDTHPLRTALEQASRGLEEHRWVAEATVADVAKKHGSFCADVNGFHFEDVAAWFKDGSDIYYDCPSISIGKGVRRSNTLHLQGVASIRDVERRGKSFADAILRIAEGARPKAKRSLVRTAKLFDKDCETLERALKRVKIRSRDRVEFFLCMQRKGLPTPVAEVVLEYLV